MPVIDINLLLMLTTHQDHSILARARTRWQHYSNRMTNWPQWRPATLLINSSCLSAEWRN